MTEPATEAEQNAVSPAYGIYVEKIFFLYTSCHNKLIRLIDYILIKSQVAKVIETKH